MQHSAADLLVPLITMLAWPFVSGTGKGDLSGTSPQECESPRLGRAVGAMLWHVPALCTAAICNIRPFAIKPPSLLSPATEVLVQVFDRRFRDGCNLTPLPFIFCLFSVESDALLIGSTSLSRGGRLPPLYATGGGSPELLR